MLYITFQKNRFKWKIFIQMKIQYGETYRFSNSLDISKIQEASIAAWDLSNNHSFSRVKLMCTVDGCQNCFRKLSHSPKRIEIPKPEISKLFDIEMERNKLISPTCYSFIYLHVWTDDFCNASVGTFQTLSERSNLDTIIRINNGNTRMR